MPDLTSMVTDTLAKFSLSTVLSAVAILLICLVVVQPRQTMVFFKTPASRWAGTATKDHS